MKISSKSVQWEPSAGMRTDLTKLIVVFRDLANEPEKKLLTHQDDLIGD
jgi:hypothetical protein